MPRNAKDVTASLTGKGFQPHDGDHHFYRLFIDGKNAGIRTKISHGERDIGDNLLAQMAKQTKLVKKEFLELVASPLTLDQYVKLLRERGHLPPAKEQDGGKAQG